ncbi:hypothetical protein [Hwanghaeella sp.]|uniref:hypothetical protein n=1 Tax=Hwanghaeella sp. TaxID=2605943 RepID=UPI003CCC3537
MESKHEDVQPITRHEFFVDCFDIEDRLLGRAHKFERAGKKVTIRLPTKREINRGPGYNPTNYGMLRSHRPGPRGGIRDATYSIHRVLVFIQMTESVRVPVVLPSALRTPYESMSKGDQEKFSDSLKPYGLLANEVFRFWLRVMRWKTGEGLLGRVNLDMPDQAHGANVIDPRQNTSFGTGYGHYVVSRNYLVTNSDWQDARAALRKGDEPPVWANWIAEGKFSEANGNIQGAVAYYAIACESFFLSEFFDAFPTQTTDNIIDVVEHHITGRMLIDRFAKPKWQGLSKSDWSRIHELFDIRNKIVHTGHSPTVTVDKCSKIRKTVHKLFYGPWGNESR